MIKSPGTEHFLSQNRHADCIYFHTILKKELDREAEGKNCKIQKVEIPVNFVDFLR